MKGRIDPGLERAEGEAEVGESGDDGRTVVGDLE